MGVAAIGMCLGSGSAFGTVCASVFYRKCLSERWFCVAIGRWLSDPVSPYLHFSDSCTQSAVRYRPTSSYVMLPSAASSQLSDRVSCRVSVSCIRQLSALSFFLYSVICSASTANNRVSALPYHPLLSPTAAASTVHARFCCCAAVANRLMLSSQ